MKNNLITLLTFLGLYLSTAAQNLIPNGSFEEFKTTDNPYAPKQFKNLAGGWELFTTCRTKFRPGIFAFTFKNNEVNHLPDGEVILDYHSYRNTIKDNMCKTVFQVAFTETLDTGAFYRLSYYIQITSPQKGTGKAVLNNKFVQFYTFPEKISKATDIELLKKKEKIGSLPKGKQYDYYNYWVPVSFDFQAKGGEKYLVFGTIDTCYSEYDLVPSIDKIEMVKIDKPEDILSNTEVGTNLIIKNILFEYDKAILKESSCNVLNKLVKELQHKPTLKIEISGHTDNTGSKEHNLELSEQRAKAVVTYFVHKGVSTSRLSYKGYGDSKPIAENNRDEGREQNRRVEINVLEK